LRICNCGVSRTGAGKLVDVDESGQQTSALFELIAKHNLSRLFLLREPRVCRNSDDEKHEQGVAEGEVEADASFGGHATNL
jgi:hypothetical protein